MSEPILDPKYWKQRLGSSGDQLHRSIFITHLANWEAIEAKHRILLAKHIMKNDSILDAGCGYGRLLTLLPPDWDGDYTGIDLSPDFIELARKTHPNRKFQLGDLRNLPYTKQEFDWAICISIRPMVQNNLGFDVWDQIEGGLRIAVNKILLLEYSAGDEGTVLFSEGL